MSPKFIALTLALPVAAVSAQVCPTPSSVPLAAGPNQGISAAVAIEDRMYVRGGFSTIGGAPAVAVARYDGGSGAGAWTPMSSGWLYAANQATDLAPLGSRLYATSLADFGVINWDAPNGLVWNGSAWVQWPTTGLLPGVGAAPTRRAFNVGGRLLVEGNFPFVHPNPNLLHIRRFAFFDGESYSMAGSQYGINVHPDATSAALACVTRFGGNIYVGGSFNAIARGESYNTNTVPAASICMWDGSAFQPLPNGGLNGRVRAMARFQDELYVAGDFTATADGSIALNHIASFDGSWHRVGGGINQPVQGMVVADDGTGEKLHIVVQSDAAATAYNQPLPTTDTVAFRGVVRWTGLTFQAYGPPASAGIFGASTTIIPVRCDNGSGEAVYFFGGTHTTNGAQQTRASRWGPGPMLDADQDGIFDLWETNGIDADCDGNIDLNLPAMGANPNHVDVFVEVDSMAGRAPIPAALGDVVAAFAAAPAQLIGNPDGADGVSLHLIVDPADQTIPLQDLPNTFADFHPLKNQRFGDAADRASPNRAAILDAKKRIFRYCIFANTYDNGRSSGVAECPGNDFIVTLGTSTPAGGTRKEQAATFMHELGHTLGLFHGGHQGGLTAALDRRFNYKPNYHSIMNYSWQLESARAGWTLDYSRRVLPMLDETQLDEPSGIGGAPGAITLAGPPPGRPVPESGPVDWDNSGFIELSPSVRDINRIEPQAESLDVLEGSEDWSRLVYNFRHSAGYASGDSPESTFDTDHMTPELAAALAAIGATPCPADVAGLGGAPGRDGQISVDDLIYYLAQFFANNLAVADLVSLGGGGGPDGLISADDLIAFLAAFFAGCP